MRVHKGDTVLVISGKDKGAKGKVLEAYPTRDKVLVEESTASRSTPRFPAMSAVRSPAGS